MSDILDTLRGYNTPDRVLPEQVYVATDIHDAANEIEKLRAALTEKDAEIDAITPDALRYRFLRDGWPEAIHVRDMVTKMRLTEDYLDGAVDTAMAYENSKPPEKKP